MYIWIRHPTSNQKEYPNQHSPLFMLHFLLMIAYSEEEHSPLFMLHSMITYSEGDLEGIQK